MITFWLILTAAALFWYSSITIFVAIKGARDIREMLLRLKKRGQPGRWGGV